MKIALLGAGKTGSKICEIHQNVAPFDSKTPPSIEALKAADVVVSFLPGEAFVSYLDMLIEAGRPVVTGSTGFEWPENMDKTLKEKKLRWIRAHNFSLGMNVVREMIQKMSYLSDLFEDGEFAIHDIHHVHKKDSPSGTALSWKEWLGKEAEITAERKGDVVGFHSLKFDCQDETITLVHEAKDRSIFARGALWAAKILYGQQESQSELDYGLLDFNEVVKKLVFK